MLIINADDWGGWSSATDAALACFRNGRISSASAMVFMEDSQRAADLAKDMGLDIGLHVNFTLPFTDTRTPSSLAGAHERLSRFLARSRYAQVLYNPLLSADFSLVYQAQVDEFRRLYDAEPSHVDGHRHMHLCANVLVGSVIAPGQAVRRNFSFWPGEKSWLNRWYRHGVDRRLARRYRVTDYFFSLEQCLRSGSLSRVAGLARSKNVELMAHPEKRDEMAWLMSDAWAEALGGGQDPAHRNLSAWGDLPPAGTVP